RVSTAPGPGTIFVFRHDGQNYCPPFVLDSTYYSGFSNAVIYRNSTSGAKNIILSSNYSVNAVPNTFRIRINEYNHNFQQISSAYVFNSFWEAYEISAAYLNTGNIIDVLFTNSAMCYALNAPGGVLGGFPVPASNANANKSVLCGYLSQDENVVTSLGMAEYDDKITDTVKGFIKVFKYNGTEESWSPLRPKGIVNSAPTICDLNKDGQPDLAAVSSYSYGNGNRGTIVYAWSFPNAAYLNDSADWHMLRHDMYRTNQNGFRPKELVSGISPLNTVIPSSFSLSQNYPNPFNPMTKIKFSIPNSTPLTPLQRGTVLLKVYDITGKEVAVLVNEVLQPGTYEVTFDASGLTSGVYFYKLQAGEYTETKRMALLKCRVTR
ncbi:MAG: T9SS type A sorting domain-containing protein, partial [Ignavibacteria bacterium]|nr:T9SS type A sorting domain-containing protein [Ignavibacteria bacterium]